MKKIKLIEKWIGDEYPCYIIAEIGNLFKNFEEAKRLIDSAKEIGVDAIKFQTWDVETLTTKNNNFDLEITGHVSQYEFLKDLQISEKLQQDIINYAKQKKITIFSAPSHQNDIELMERLEIPIYKIGSDLACHIPLLKKIAKFQKPIILSTGMCTLEEVRTSVNTILDQGNDQLILLHCISDYPTKDEESNLNAILEMKKEFQIPVGFSDHSVGDIVSQTAVSLGANMIEKHMKHPNNPSYPDDIHSLNPIEFENLIKSIRFIEKIKGVGKKIPSKSEKINLTNNRVSIIVMQNIEQGTKLTPEMVDIRRPGNGIQPKYLDEIIGKTVTKNIDAETPLDWSMIR